MASTFDNDLRLEEMATGENAGSWGTKTNTNLELIADAFGYGTFTIADADTTLTIPDGSGANNALRSLYLKINSSADLTTTRVLTIDPNTVNKLWYIENNTSGGQTITISQGSGANVSILNGQAKLVATDGAGATAAVIDATQDLAIPDLFIDDDLSLQSDGAIINFGADADVNLTHVADTGLRLNAAMALQFRDSALSISSSADGQLDIDADTEVEIVAPTVDVDASTAMTIDTTTLTVTGNTVLTGDLTVDTDTLYVDSANDRVGVGTASPSDLLELSGSTAQPAIRLTDTDVAGLYHRIFTPSDSGLAFSADTGNVAASSFMRFDVDNVEAMRIDSSQRTIIGGYSHVPIINASVQASVVGGSADSGAGGLGIARFGGPPIVGLASSPNTTVGSYTLTSNGTAMGYLYYGADDGTDLRTSGAYIAAVVDGAPAANDMPGRLVFATTISGAATPTERMRINNSGDVTIGNAADARARLEVYDDGVSAVYDAGDLSTWRVMQVRNNIESFTGTAAGIAFGGDGSGDTETAGIVGISDNSTGGIMQLAFITATGNNSLEAMRIDSSQRVLIGATSSQPVFLSSGNQLQIQGLSSNTSAASITRHSNDGGGPYLNFGKTRGTADGAVTSVADADVLGQIWFIGADGTDIKTPAAGIFSQVDGTPGSNDMPGRLSFQTTSDGASATTERMRIDSTGQVILYGNGATTMHLTSTSPILAFTDTNDFADPNDRVQIRATKTNSTDNLAIQFYDDSASTTANLAQFFSDGVVSFGNATPTVTGLQIGGDAITTLNPTVVISKADSGGTDTSVVIRGGSPVLAFDVTSGGNATILTDGSVLRIKGGDLDNQGTILAAFSTTGFAVGTGGGTQLYSASTELASPLHIVNTSDSSSFASVQQTINGSITSGASGAWKDICRSDHTYSLNVQLIASDSSGVSIGSAHLNASLGGAYGGGTSKNTLTSGSLSGGNITGIDIRYLNAAGTSGTSYVLQAQVTYTGSAKTIYFNVSGMSVGRIYPV